MKHCTACNTEKPESEFYRDRSRPDGLNWRCKPCHRLHIADVAMRPPRNLAPEGMKRCQRCKETKPLDQFFADKNQYDGKQRACRDCQVTRHKNWVDKNRPQLAAKQRERYRKNLDRYADYERRGHYGLPPGAYAQMLSEQGGGCAICHTSDPAPSRNFAVDHNHKTNKVRGLLCGNCNNGLGRFRDDPTLLEEAIKYLLKYS